MSTNMKPEHCCSKYQNLVQFHPWWNTTDRIIDNIRWKQSALYTMQDLRDENLNALSCYRNLLPLEKVLSIAFSLWITYFIGSNNELTFDFKAVILKYSEKAQRLPISTWNPGCSASSYRSYTQGQFVKVISRQMLLPELAHVRHLPFPSPFLNVSSKMNLLWDPLKLVINRLKLALHAFPVQRQI